MTEEAESWVVYLITIHKSPEPRRAVCSRPEWEALERDRPGYHRLIREDIPSERDAELIARGTSGDAVKRATKP